MKVLWHCVLFVWYPCLFVGVCVFVLLPLVIVMFIGKIPWLISEWGERTEP